MKFWIRWLITAIAVGFAVWILPRSMVYIDMETSVFFAILVISVILAFLNVFIKPFLQFLSCGVMILTLGLFSLVINAGLFAFAAWIGHSLLEIGFYFPSPFWGPFWAGIIVSIVTSFLSIFIDDKDDSDAIYLPRR